ncbi:MAG: rhodanese-like domain-containing protein [Terriglobia bacterium]|jgi:hypothetical protein
MGNSGRRMVSRFRLLGLAFAALAVLFIPQQFLAQANKNSAADPWDKTQVMTPEELVKLLANPDSANPLVVCVGFEFLYKGAHVPGARFIGHGKDAKGIEALKRWAGSIPPDRDIVIYCGCCPLKQCPNLRPAFQALRETKPTHLKVLFIEESLAKDWVEKGYPVEKGGEQK